MKKIYAFLLVFLLVGFGCGGKDKVKPSADSITARDAIIAVDLIKNAYIKKDKEEIRDNIASPLSEDIVNEMFFEKAELTFFTRMIRIRSADVIVRMNWQGEWIIDGKTIKDIGVSTMILQKNGMKLLKIDGDNPFRIPVVK